MAMDRELAMSRTRKRAETLILVVLRLRAALIDLRGHRATEGWELEAGVVAQRAVEERLPAVLMAADVDEALVDPPPHAPAEERLPTVLMAAVADAEAEADEELVELPDVAADVGACGCGCGCACGCD